ncbi:MAG: hypothetical protein KGI06_04790 [Candidatus Micrarchaeota archaeon]|nr:hypothetical protein [Candidatus Micrarchaeota archaeon]
MSPKICRNYPEFVRKITKYLTIPSLVIIVLASRFVEAGSVPLVTEINNIQLVLTQVGPALSAVLFVLAGIFYAIGQMLPPDKKANFHTAAVNMIIGAIVVGVLSVASTSLAIASTHLIGNFTSGNSLI